MYWSLIKVITFSVILSKAVLAQTESDERESLPSKDEPRTESITLDQDTSIESESSKIYGETDAEQLGDFSVVDLIFRKRRQSTNCENNQGNIDEIRSPEAPKTDEEVSVEEIELVSYEEISNAEEFHNEEPALESRSNPPEVMEYLTPPALDANCTYNQNDESTTAGTETQEVQAVTTGSPEAGDIPAHYL